MNRLFKRIVVSGALFGLLYGGWYAWMGYPIAGYNICTNGWKIMSESDRVLQSLGLIESAFRGDVARRKEYGKPELNEKMFREMVAEMRVCANERPANCQFVERYYFNGSKRNWRIRHEDTNMHYILDIDAGNIEESNGSSGYSQLPKEAGRSSIDYLASSRIDNFSNFHSIPGCWFNGVWGAD